MTQTFHRRSVLRASLALGAAAWLPGARACEYFAPNLRITHPWTRASAPDASVALVCMKFDEVTLADRLIAVETPVAAAAEMGGAGARPGVDFAIPEGQESAFTEAGIHLRLLGLKHPLEVARAYPLKLVFEHAGTVRATLNVDFARFG